jgi:hypothetical protein
MTYKALVEQAQEQQALAAKALEMRRRLLSPPEAGQYLGGIVAGTLAKWRHYGEGPEYLKVGSRVFYEQSSLDAFLDARRRMSTSEETA